MRLIPFRLAARVCGLVIIPLFVLVFLFLTERHIALLNTIPLTTWHRVSIPISSVFDSQKPRWVEMRLGKTIPVSGAPGFEVSAEIPGGLFIKGSLSSSGKDRIVRGILRPYGSLMTSKFLPEAVRKRIKGRVAVLSVDESPIPFLLSRARQWMVILSSGLSAGALTLLWFSLLNRKRVLPRAPQLLRRLCWLMGAVGVAWSVYLSLRYRPTVSDTSILVLGAVVSSLLIAELALSRFPPAATSNV